ncbi:WD40-like Beta Propeller Repeat [Lishizhenia tianjinensis]|uniref:WD40-like Beta Propeller Repeat n=1 Tax=Lishizhenia tianjinensis TaxID=477690 RepID=A0A1I7AGJ1_9FLAO|nr:OmpA family protein [Lishizhenia tianjinensis]SFT74061.1 WD40-like Beta Propeller Repeat [Lishizhenia tianjinensis]
MLKNFLILTLLFAFTAACGTAQMQYSSKDKKAVKLFEKARTAPDAEKIEILNDALERDPNFLEAHDLISQIYADQGEFEKSVYHEKELLRINPAQNFNGTLYISIAQKQFALGNYEDAVKYTDMVINYPRRTVADAVMQEAYELQKSAKFSIEAIENARAITPINIGPGINTEYDEYFPTITVDGKVMLFTRKIPANNMMGFQEDFFVSELSDKFIWQMATAMPPNINSPLNEGAPTLSSDGKSLVFVACESPAGIKDYGPTKKGYGRCDMFYTKKIGSRWVDPINLPGYANTSNWESQPSLSSDGKTLYFVRRTGHGYEANSDIYVTYKDDKGYWSKAERLPENINTPFQETSVLIHPDGQTLYFASNGHTGLGGSDIFMSKKNPDGTWGDPVNLGYPINTKANENSLLVSADGEIAFFASDRDGGQGGLDIYYFEMPEELRPTKTLYFDGFVYDASTRNPLPGKFELIDIANDEVVITAEADKVTGEFLVALPTNRKYALNVSYPGYAFFSKSFDMTSGEDNEGVHMDVPMHPLAQENAIVELENVFFDLNKTTLRKESFTELDKLYKLLAENTSLKIEIGGHTDTRGDAADNQKLSEGRAQAVYDYLVDKGIAAERLKFKGYGETQPKISDEEIAKLATDKEKEAAHQQNRRTEYKIIK